MTHEKQKILIVDDNKQNIEILMDLFSDTHKVIAATNAKRALKMASSSTPPDIVLTDIIMPEMDGYDLCQALKEDESTKNIPVIFITAVSEVMDATKGFNLGAVDYITKPFHPPMVKARVEVHLDLKHKREMLEDFAYVDALTEIPNRRHFDVVLDKELKRARRSGKPLSLLFLDVDHFKQYNDTYGHGTGDKCLYEVAQKIEDTLQRAGDFTARYGGEEFATVLPYTESPKAQSIAEEIRLAVEALAIPHESSTASDYVTVSIGVADSTGGNTLEELIAAADKALYAAKNQGRNRVCLAALD